MSSVIEEVTEKAASMTLTAGGSARWLAPELIDGSILSPTMAADTYSFAMAILELLTMKRPYAHRKRDASVIHDVVIMKVTPPRPEDPDSKQWLTDALWALMQECWYSNASSRPVMSQVATRMAAMEVEQRTF
jgi:serine/threonine protein kinase